MNNMPIELYSDGSCLNNPGPGGIGYVIRYWTMTDDAPQLQVIEKCKGYRHTTNNRMEIIAGLTGLNDILVLIEAGTVKNVAGISLITDSKYFCDAVNLRWVDKWQQNNWMTAGFQGKAPQPVKNRDLWEQVISTFGKMKAMGFVCSVNHIPGHKGYEFNERADTLAVSAARGTDHIADDVYERMNPKR